MATTNYTLYEYPGTGGAQDTVSAARLNKPTDVLDRALHFGLTLLPDGRLTGANIQTNKRIAYPGTGMVDGCAWAIDATLEQPGNCQAGSSDTQIKDTANLNDADSYWVDAWVFAESGANDGEYRQVTAFDQATSTLTVGSAFTAAFAVGDSYRVTFIAIKPDTLTNSATNYVFGQRVTYGTQGWTTEQNGIIRFYASTVATITTGEIYLGTIVLDGAGVATAVDNDPSSDVDVCYAIDIKDLRGTSLVSGLAGGATSQFYLTFADSILLGPILTLSMDDANFSVTLDEYYENDRIRVTVTNNSAYSASSTLTWKRRCAVA